MKRKHSVKLILNRETLRRLDPSLLSQVGGALKPYPTGYTDCVSRCASVCCVGTTDTYDTCGANTMENCSAAGFCQTGGACSDGC